MPRSANHLFAVGTAEILIVFAVLPALFRGSELTADLLHPVFKARVFRLPLRYVSLKNVEDPQDGKNDSDSIYNIVKNPENGRSGQSFMPKANQRNKCKQDCNDQTAETDSVQKLGERINTVAPLHESI